MNYISLSLVKILDNIISTAKSIATYQEKKILSSVLVAVSQLIFYLVIGQVVNDGSLLVIFIVAISSGVGNWIAFSINDVSAVGHPFMHTYIHRHTHTHTHDLDLNFICNTKFIHKIS